MLDSHASHAIFQVYNGFQFMEGLVEEMTHMDPARRPTIEDVSSRFSRIRDSLSVIKLRSLITSRKEPRLITTFRCARHVIRTVKYIILKKAVIPDA